MATAPDCRACGSPAVAFAVPEDFRAEAPEGAARAAICTRCLRTFPVDDEPSAESADEPERGPDSDPGAGAEPDFSAVHPGFPGGRGGVAFALACGLLGSLALNRAAIESLAARAEREGVDVFLAFDRLSAADVEPHFDVDRRRTQLEQFL